MKWPMRRYWVTCRGDRLRGGLRTCRGGFRLFFFLLPAALAAAGAVHAADAKSAIFLGQPITKAPGTYLVTQDVLVRAAPDSKGEKVGSYSAGDRVFVAGKAAGSWLAVRAKGKEQGFIYGPVLVPLIDSGVKVTLAGQVNIAGGDCDFRLSREGETPIEGQLFNSLDYRAQLDCRRGNKSYGFEVPLFITEGPYNGGARPVYQIGIDVLELAQDYERVFSTNLLYDKEKGEVRLDSVTVDKYQLKKPPAPVPVETVAEALTGGLGLAVQSWSVEFWTDLGKALSHPADR